ncbi:RNA 2',3'-cyclic phosphodiesterase [Fervidibacillus albus]|uniref:RNA 2',3'-cyclic phosphodiesterase n=1 Tax=Fervidibacillus albus TaxID=2980026 RepID=A0A9E8LUS8_9BACI|nr:RNA 2',3'-cyclic phosphodiesterase [Fervidibacillus albus]WAA10078.1 RNA 2',3'-cyclic phosphodiesterase [Fervidibacillus albus]
MEKQHHYFIAVKLTDEAKQFLHDWVEKNVRTFPFRRWVHKEDYHITLAFLGYVEKNQLNKTAEMLREVTKGEHSFPLTFKGVGTFGAKASPRIFWADVFPSEPLIEMQRKVADLCKLCGHRSDGKPFRPHITLARKWSGTQSFTQKSINEIRTEKGGFFTFSVTEIVLYETHFERSPKYKPLHTFPLRV